jgi:hypothetical protein
MEQVPTATRVTAGPVVTVQTEGEFEVSVTVNAEDAVALSPDGSEPNGFDMSGPNVIVCAVNVVTRNC